MELVKNLENIKGVSEANSRRGMYDGAAMVQGDSFSKVKEIVSKRIKGMVDVKSLTLTLIDSPL